MVVKLIGKVNGQNIIFNHKEGDVWETVIPKNLSGVYVIELTAYDEVGNKGYAAKYLVTVDTKHMTVRLEKLPWQSKLKETFFKIDCQILPFWGKLKEHSYKRYVSVPEFYARLIE